MGRLHSASLSNYVTFDNDMGLLCLTNLSTLVFGCTTPTDVNHCSNVSVYYNSTMTFTIKH